MFVELTKYEEARIIGARALQLAKGAPPLIKPKSTMNFIDVAREELKKGVIPLVVKREKVLSE